MSSDVYVKVKMRAIDARRFVRGFKKECDDQIEGARKVKTEGDALDMAFVNNTKSFCTPTLRRRRSIVYNIRHGEMFQHRGAVLSRRALHAPGA